MMPRIIALLFFLSISPATAQGLEVGERAVYSLRWSYFSVGTVVISLNWAGEGESFLEARLDASANAFMRRFHDFHTVITSRFPPGVERSHGYLRDEAADNSIHEIIFDWEAGQVRYSKNGDIRHPLPLVPLTHDPLSVVFAFRSGAIPLTPGLHQTWVTDGKIIDQIEFTVREPEKVKTPAGKFLAYRITADFREIRAIFARPPGALIHVWLTADENMIPVKLESEATIGSFYSVLTDYSTPQSAQNPGH